VLRDLEGLAPGHDPVGRVGVHGGQPVTQPYPRYPTTNALTHCHCELTCSGRFALCSTGYSILLTATNL
jgi:hypothetical protein